MRRLTPNASDGPNRRYLLILALPALILIIAAFVLAWQFVRPAAPKRIVMSTGATGGAVCVLLPEHFAAAFGLTACFSVLASLAAAGTCAKIEPSEVIRDV